MRSIAARAASARRNEEGLTLLEILVTMSIFAIVIAIAFPVLVAVQKDTVAVGATADSVFEARRALAEIDKQVRSGNVLYSPADEPAAVTSCTADGASGTCMRIFTQTYGVPRCVQWQVIADPSRPGTSLLRSRGWATTWLTDGNTSAWKTVARGLKASPSTLPFTLQGGATTYKSRLLDVRLEAVDARRPTKSVVISSSLAGRNTNYGYDSGLCSPVPPA